MIYEDKENLTPFVSEDATEPAEGGDDAAAPAPAPAPEETGTEEM